MNAPNMLPSIWNVPYQRNPFFTGREEALRSLYRALQIENVVALSHPQGISGMGGIGKTQTALEYAYRYGADYDAVLWVRADSIGTLTSSFVELAHLLDLPERNEQDQSIIVEAVLRWLHLHRGWLLIFDNMDNLSATEPFLPKAGLGHTLFTTRMQALGGIAQRLEVQQMEPNTGALLLLRRATILPLQATLDLAPRDDCAAASKISQELDGLPLALDQAGAYIKETPCTLIDYLAIYKARRQDLLRTRGSFDKDYPASVATTWSLSFEKVAQANPAAGELLDFCAFLAPDAIPEDMITQGAHHLTPLVQVAVVDPLLFDQTIATLLAYSLINRSTDSTLNVHRLVQAVLRDSMLTDVEQQWKQRAVRIVATTFPDIDQVSLWSTCERWLPHALVCATWIEQTQIAIPEAASLLLLHTGRYLDERARYIEAEPLYQRALHICKEQLGPMHPGVAASLNNLAALCLKQGKFAEAELILQQAQHIWEKQLGPMQPFLASSLNNLANLYKEQGKYAKAEPLYQRALLIWEEELGPMHPNIASSLNGLAILYTEQGKYAKAESLYQRALRIREEQLGLVNPDVASSLNGLALLYTEQGKYAEAEPLLQRALLIWEEQFGPVHPDVASALNNLGAFYANQSKYTEAKPLLQRSVEIYTHILGRDHPITRTIARNYSHLLQIMKREEKQGRRKSIFRLFS